MVNGGSEGTLVGESLVGRFEGSEVEGGFVGVLLGYADGKVKEGEFVGRTDG